MSAKPARSAHALLRDLGALVLGEGVAKLAGFAAFAYLARTLPPERYGAVELASAITMLFFLVVDFGFAPIGARELARDRTRALSLLATPWINNWLFQALGEMLVVAAAQALRMLGFALLVVALVHANGSLGNVAAAEIGASLVLAVYYLAMQFRIVGTPRLSFDSRPLAHLLRESAPVGISRILWAVSQYAGTVVVASHVSTSEVAWYGAAHRLTIAMGAFVQLYHFNLFPALIEAASASQERLRDFLAPQMRATFWLAALGGLVGVAFGEPICALLYGAAYARSGELLGWLVWSLSAALVGSHARFLLLATGRQRGELIANAIGAAVALCASLALVPLAGARGAAIAIVAGALATWASAHTIVVRSGGQSLPGLSFALRPALACALIGVAGRWLPVEGELVRGAIQVLALALAAPLIDPALRRDVRRLLTARGAPG